MADQTEIPVELPAAAAIALARGSKLDAIKELRAATGLGLFEAKLQVEKYVAARPMLKQQLEQTSAAGRSRLLRWFLVIDLLIVAAVIWWFFVR